MQDEAWGNKAVTVDMVISKQRNFGYSIPPLYLQPTYPWVALFDVVSAQEANRRRFCRRGVRAGQRGFAPIQYGKSTAALLLGRCLLRLGSKLIDQVMVVFVLADVPPSSWSEMIQ